MKRFTLVAQDAESALGSEDVSEYFKTESARLLGALNKLRADATLEGIATTAEKGQEVKVKAQELERDAVAADRWFYSALARIEKLEEDINLIKQDSAQGNAKTSFEHVIKQLGDLSARDPASRKSAEEMMTKAEKEVAAIKAGLGGSSGERARALQALKGSIDEEAKRKRDEEEAAIKLRRSIEQLKTMASNLDKQYSRVEKLVDKAKYGDKEELASIKALLKALATSIKGEQIDEALRQGLSATNRLDALEKDPGGGRMRNAKALADIATLWGEARGKTENAIGKVIEGIDKAAIRLSLQPPDVAKAKSAVNEFLRRFDTARLIEVSRTVGNDDAAIPARRTAREDAMREIRALRRLVEEDPIAQKIQGNPFGTHLPLRALGQFLTTTELNVLRAVPADE